MLLALPTSHTSIQYIDYFEIFNVSLDLPAIYLLVLVDVECTVCLRPRILLSIFWSRLTYKIVLF